MAQKSNPGRRQGGGRGGGGISIGTGQKHRQNLCPGFDFWTIDFFGPLRDPPVAHWRHLGPISSWDGGIFFYSLTEPAPAGGTPSAYSGANTTYLLYLPIRNTLVDDAAAVGVPAGAYLAGTPPHSALRTASPPVRRPVLVPGVENLKSGLPRPPIMCVWRR